MPVLNRCRVMIFSTNSIIDSEDEPLPEGTTKRLLKSKCDASILLQAYLSVMRLPATPLRKPRSRATSLQPVIANLGISDRINCFATSLVDNKY